MLIKFAVKNYRGFSDRIEWDLSHPSSYTFNTNLIKDGIVKNGIVYGPNECGKTNLSMAVFDIVNHLTQKFKKVDYYNNFVYAGTPSALVEFEYTFKFDEQQVEYSYSKMRDGILVNESLAVNGKYIFVRKGKSFTIDENAFPMNENVKNDLAENANHVSVVNFLIASYPLPEDNLLIRLRNFADGMLWLGNPITLEFIGFLNSIYASDEYIIKEGLVDDFQRFLNTVSEQTFHFVKPEKNDKVLLCEYGNEKVSFSVIASSSTKVLKQLYFWIQKMTCASFVFIDELDVFFHHETDYKVCRRLLSLDCQVFISSHNTYLMTNDLLRPDCYFILNDNRIKAMCDCTQKELRFGHNLEKLYRGGTFGL